MGMHKLLGSRLPQKQPRRSGIQSLSRTCVETGQQNRCRLGMELRFRSVSMERTASNYASGKDSTGGNKKCDVESCSSALQSIQYDYSNLGVAAKIRPLLS